MLTRRLCSLGRTLHSSAVPLRNPRPPPSPSRSRSPPHSATRSTYQQRGNTQWNSCNTRQSSKPTPAPSDISLPALADKLNHHLDQVWKRAPTTGQQAVQLRQLAADLALNPARLRSLADDFAHHALAALPARGKGKAKAVDKSQGTTTTDTVQWDLDALRTAYIADGPKDALFHASLAAFLVYLQAHHPLPRPSFRNPTPDPTLHKLHDLAAIADRRFQSLEAFPLARQQRRRLILHVGPTNSGKTHSALVALARARTGAYAGPLRLLAHEVFARFNEGTIGDEGKRTCNLVTGEEQRILDPDAGLQSCTVEMFPLSRRLDVGVVDEIQMLGDPQRGSAWTAAVVGSLCDELHLCGEESVVELVQQIAKEVGDECIVKRYQRLSPLVVAEQSLDGDLSRIRRGDCLVTFSRSNIFAFKRSIEQHTGLKVAVAYGGLPPEVREEQARAFNAGEYDVLVASDAVGMGLNLKIRRIVFESLHKWDGQAEIRLPTPQIKQIAGRAGRFGVHTPNSPSAPDLDAPLPPPSPSSGAKATADESPLGEATTLDAVDLPLLREAMQQPTVQVTQASLSAPVDAFRALYALLPPSTPMSRLFALSRAITRTKPFYRVSGTESFGAVGDKIAHVAPLTFSERYTFGCAPVNLRDARVVDALVEWAGMFARGERIEMQQWGTDKGVFAALDKVDRVVAEVERQRRASSTPGGAPDLPRRQQAVFTPEALQQLESHHRCLTLYLWLSYRMAPVFSDQDAARQLRARVERAIEQALEGIRFERVSRGKGAKRNKARVWEVAAQGEGQGQFDEWLKTVGKA
ncbi:hypothetical protein JCM10207_004383 [Rhodosporidiobolus poonsookiae]